MASIQVELDILEKVMVQYILSSVKVHVCEVINDKLIPHCDHFMMIKSYLGLLPILAMRFYRTTEGNIIGIKKR